MKLLRRNLRMDQLHVFMGNQEPGNFVAKVFFNEFIHFSRALSGMVDLCERSKIKNPSCSKIVFNSFLA